MCGVCMTWYVCVVYVCGVVSCVCLCGVWGSDAWDKCRWEWCIVYIVRGICGECDICGVRSTICVVHLLWWIVVCIFVMCVFYI